MRKTWILRSMILSLVLVSGAYLTSCSGSGGGGSTSGIVATSGEAGTEPYTEAGDSSDIADDGSGVTDQTDGSETAQGTLVAYDDVWSVYEGRTTVIPVANLIENDTDETDNGPLVISEIVGVEGGTAKIEGTTILFTPHVSAGEPASFRYSVKNTGELIAEANVRVTVETAPSVIAAADNYDVVQGKQLIVLSSALIANDEGQGNLTITGVGNPTGGDVSVNGDTITFTSTGFAYEPAGFEYTVHDDAYNTTAVGNVYVNIQVLPAVEAYIYHNTAALNEKKNSYVPPTVQDIFNKWGRFNGNAFFENMDDPDIDRNAAAWIFLEDPDRVSMPLNVTPYNGFVSPEKIENYTFEATLSSPDSDNDTVSLVIAFARIGDENYVLSAERTMGGTSPRSGWGVIYGTGITGANYNDYGVEWLINEKAVGENPSYGWSGAKTRVRIERNGDIIKCYTTNWNDAENFQASSEIVIDLASDPRLEKFRGPQSYGYGTYSQPDSTYLDINFNGGMDVTKLIDANTFEVWEYITGDGWTVTDKNAMEELGYVRKVRNPETGIDYLIKKDSIEIVED